MAAGCRERLNREFLEFVAYTATFRRRMRPRIVTNLDGYSGRYIRLSSRKQVARFVDRVPESRA